MRPVLVSKFVLLGFTGSLVLTAWALCDSSTAVSLHVTRVVSLNEPNETPAEADSRQYLEATVELANQSSRRIRYLGRGNDQPAYTILSSSKEPWTESGESECFLSYGQLALEPGQSVTFRAVILGNQPCRLALNYNDDRLTSRLWRRLPRQVTTLLGWSGERCVKSDTISFRADARVRSRPQ